MNATGEPEIPPCFQPGQDDIYGMGIRVSLYMQWFSTVLAYLYEPDLATESTVVNYIFSISVAICALVHRAEINQREIIIIATLLMLPPTVFAVSLLDNIATIIRRRLPSRYRTKGHRVPNPQPRAQTPGPNPSQQDDQIRPHPSPESTPHVPPKQKSAADVRYEKMMRRLKDIAALVATTFLLSVAVWELFDGVDKGPSAAECQPKFIRSHYLSGVYEMVLKVVAIMFTVAAPMGLLSRIAWRDLMEEATPDPVSVAPPHSAEFLQVANTLSQTGEKTALTGAEAAHTEAEAEEIQDLTRSIDDERSPFRKESLRSAVAFIWGALASFAIAQIETVIKQNKIQGLQDPTEAGQLIPLIIGVCQFCVVAYGYCSRHLKVGTCSPMTAGNHRC